MIIYVYADRVSVNYVASAMCLDMFLCYILRVLGFFFFFSEIIGFVLCIWIMEDGSCVI